MRKEYRAGLVGGSSVAATYVAFGLWQFDPHPVEVAAGCLMVFAVFFGLFYRLEKTGNMMSPLWMGIFGIAAFSRETMQWFEDRPSGLGLVVSVAFLAMFAFLGVVGVWAWIRSERRDNQHSGA